MTTRQVDDFSRYLSERLESGKALVSLQGRGCDRETLVDILYDWALGPAAVSDGLKEQLSLRTYEAKVLATGLAKIRRTLGEFKRYERLDRTRIECNSDDERDQRLQIWSKIRAMEKSVEELVPVLKQHFGHGSWRRVWDIHLPLLAAYVQIVTSSNNYEAIAALAEGALSFEEQSRYQVTTTDAVKKHIERFSDTHKEIYEQLLKVSEEYFAATKFRSAGHNALNTLKPKLALLEIAGEVLRQT